MVIRRGVAYGADAMVARSANRAHVGKTNSRSLGEGFRLAESVVQN